MRTNDALHLGLMLLALAMAYLVPFELLLFSYVILGPAHYVTEISWLHDRKYFLPHKVIAIGLIAIATAAVLIDSASWFGFVMWATFVACAILAGAITTVERIVLLVVAIGLSALMYANGLSFAVLGILLPTLIHVSLFTMVFMALGAIRSGSRTQVAPILLYVAALALIVAFPPTIEARVPYFAAVAHDYFGNVAPALSRLFQIPGVRFDIRLTSLLAFVYTYHYLNWFIKADVIRWADISRTRLIGLAIASAASTALYLYDYTYGFTVLLALSLTHVLLEFPLNSLALRQLGSAIGQSAMRMRKQA